MESVRVDRWLWAARFFKTRTTATEAVAAGRVRVNDERVNPSKEICSGDIVGVRIGDLRWTVVVRGLAEKRGPARVAATLYEETSESIAERDRAIAERRLARPLGADLGPRPTKQARRQLDALRRSQQGDGRNRK
jgi:ribosome-associated heat shock protein Hsp15